ncbi:bifunctional phosphopantothenoylcysteine decarboxylase/phosphopantothenate--cysteine ligase CoaBC [Orbus sturtevantii]|uniref:bifunctional phosphopantothenoylcysteine decarboxylase/phosphopantothenate--cysteine ligase CoaBC n=1 Tax=Orbus sturtevantii TaxID=3074109 RepID=UPI00370D6528
MNLANKHILLGISGGIAAYKCPELVRQLKKLGAQVHVVMTDSAKHFVSDLSLQAVSANKVSTDLFDPSAELSMGHIELAKWADLILIAPATANIIAKLTHGLADDLLTTLCLASKAPIAIAPAMNQQMYQADITQQNIITLIERGVHIWGPDKGIQACGDIGPGRMLEPTELASNVANMFASSINLSKLNIVITAGPTQEKLDPVRYITNYSSGKMGFAIATAAATLGAKVTLISGPVNLPTPPNVNREDVRSAIDMHQKALEYAPHVDIFIACAAVADYRTKIVADQKMKKLDNSDELTITLVKNPDIVAEIAAMKKNRPFVVGFAAETNQVEEYALKKLASKNLDMICANDVSSPEQGFNVDHNALTLYWQSGKLPLPLANKNELAQQLIIEIIKHYNEYRNEKKN